MLGCNVYSWDHFKKEPGVDPIDSTTCNVLSIIALLLLTSASRGLPESSICPRGIQRSPPMLYFSLSGLPIHHALRQMPDIRTWTSCTQDTRRVNARIDAGQCSLHYFTRVGLVCEGSRMKTCGNKSSTETHDYTITMRIQYPVNSAGGHETMGCRSKAKWLFTCAPLSLPNGCPAHRWYT